MKQGVGRMRPGDVKALGARRLDCGQYGLNLLAAEASFLSSVGAPGKLDRQFAQMLQPREWNRVIQQLRRISNPTVRRGR